MHTHLVVEEKQRNSYLRTEESLTISTLPGLRDDLTYYFSRRGYHKLLRKLKASYDLEAGSGHHLGALFYRGQTALSLHSCHQGLLCGFYM